MALILERETKNFMHRAIIAENSQKAVEEFFLSKRENYNVKKYPAWDKPRVYPEYELVRARRDLAKADVELRSKWLEQERKRKDMDDQWEEMKRQELLLRDSFIKFNKFVKENQEKRERAEIKIKEEHERQSKRYSEIEELTEKVDYMKSIREKMKKNVKEYKKYQNYLERVINETGEFQSIAEIFNRYETLADARIVLAEHQDKNLRKLEETGTEIHHMSETKAQVLMGLNNKLAHYQARFDKAKALALKWETIVARIKETAAEKNLEHTQVKTCCWNLYQQICKRKGIPITVTKEDSEQQLLQIKRTILELKRIIKVAKKRAMKEENFV